MTPNDPIGDPNAHPPPLSEVRHLLKLQLIAVSANNATYIDPLRFVTVWERTDQGVDAQMPVGAPILAPCRIKILAIEPDWYAGQPLVYFELLDGPQAGQVQYVAEQITDIAPGGTILQQGQPVARYALARHGDRVRLVDDQRDHARARDDRLRGGRNHAGRPEHARWLNASAPARGRGRRPDRPRARSQLRRPRSKGSEVTSRGMSERACASASSSATAASASIVAPWPTSSIEGR